MLLNRVYYSAKPWLPPALRLAVRRWYARRIRRRSTDVWPILESAARKPTGWTGWPDNKQFALVLTHDVEGPRGLAQVKPVAELEMSLGFRSAFYFIPEGSYTVPPELRKWLTDHGFEVGVHDLHHDGKLFRSREGFRRHAQKINRYLEEWQAVGFRAGFMMRQLDWLHDLNIQYDASTFDTDPFEPQPDGVHTIFPFWVPFPSEVRDQKSEIRDQTAEHLRRDPLTSDHRSLTSGPPGYVELPYTLPQDSTLFLLLEEPDEAIWTRKLDWIAEHGGMALLNVHPDYLHFGTSNPEERGLPVGRYVGLLKGIGQRHRNMFWHGRPLELADPEHTAFRCLGLTL